VTSPQAAREGRRQIALALGAAGWPWSRRLSLWIDALVTIEERAA
jgi:hypothetical protein